MKKCLCCLCLFAFILTGENVHSKTKSNQNTQDWRYEVECERNGAEGTYMVKVWSYAKSQSAATKQAAKNAVHGVIFKGVAGKGGECVSQRPMASSPGVQYEKKDYFGKFFEDGGEYQKYAIVVGVPESIKIGKEYKVGVVVSVSKDQLRKDLESAGIIKGLSNGF